MIPKHAGRSGRQVRGVGTALFVLPPEWISGKQDMKKASVTGRRLFSLGCGFKTRESTSCMHCSFVLVYIALCCGFSIGRKAFECLKFVENYSEYSLRSRYEILKRQSSPYATAVANYGRGFAYGKANMRKLGRQRESVMTKSDFGTTMKTRESAGGV